MMASFLGNAGINNDVETLVDNFVDKNANHSKQVIL
jgi:hypothetical protein